MEGPHRFDIFKGGVYLNTIAPLLAMFSFTSYSVLNLILGLEGMIGISPFVKGAGGDFI